METKADIRSPSYSYLILGSKHALALRGDDCAMDLRCGKLWLGTWWLASFVFSGDEGELALDGDVLDPFYPCTSLCVGR